MRVTSEKCMLMGCNSREYNGTVYYNAEVYDLNSGQLYSCGCSGEVYNQLLNVAKPANMSQAYFEVERQYKNQSRLTLIGWK